jgi:hypothetical protein
MTFLGTLAVLAVGAVVLYLAVRIVLRRVFPKDT